MLRGRKRRTAVRRDADVHPGRWRVPNSSKESGPTRAASASSLAWPAEQGRGEDEQAPAIVRADGSRTPAQMIRDADGGAPRTRRTSPRSRPSTSVAVSSAARVRRRAARRQTKVVTVHAALAVSESGSDGSEVMTEHSKPAHGEPSSCLGKPPRPRPLCCSWCLDPNTTRPLAALPPRAAGAPRCCAPPGTGIWSAPPRPDERAASFALSASWHAGGAPRLRDIAALCCRQGPSPRAPPSRAPRPCCSGSLGESAYLLTSASSPSFKVLRLLSLCS